MKRIAYILLFLCCLPFMAMAQDLNPGQQSQGLLESRNVTVDYSTGIFHYQIPLYTLKSGDYELPISLRYTGKGVKVSDNPGLVGYNWTLDTGGVVTRTVRGGIPDESYQYGYLKFENDTVPLSEDATRVNRHKRDGECDIFTAVFGGKSVNFIIRKDEGYSIYAEPLERTDVKIECIQSGWIINGWIVTDNDGTRYTYIRKEWTTDLNKQDLISFNGLSNLEYVSSWYLTKIEPVNSEAIVFSYSGKDMTSYHNDSYQIRYEYGKPLQEPDYDFNFYKEDFDYWIEEARQQLLHENERLQLELSLYKWERAKQWNDSLDYYFMIADKNQADNGYEWVDMAAGEAWKYQMKDWISADMEERLATNHRVLGITGNFSPLYSSVESLMELLGSLKDTYAESPNISSCFSTARDILKEYLMGTNKKYTSGRVVNGISSCRTVSPVLTSIRTGESILFEYDRKNGHLTVVGKEARDGNTVSSNRLSYIQGKLSAVSLMDRDSVVVGTTGLDYYVPSGNTGSMADVFGFHRPYSSNPDTSFEYNMDSEYAKKHSLKEIRQADGGKVRIDYELNGVAPDGGGFVYGGIRIKSVILDNPAEGRCDTISYHYDQVFTTYWDFPEFYEEEPVYPNFTDKVWYSRVRPKTHATLSPGNNGLYYPTVREKISGQGTRILYFNFTDYGRDWSHSHWLVELPAFTVEQDEEGNVERILENLYYTDVENGLASCLFPESLIHLDAASYSKVLPQMVANEKYMDRDALEEYYGEQDGIYLDGTVINPHMEHYLNNIAPRIQYDYYNMLYSQYYGGATLLAELREYRPQAGEYTDHWELMAREQPCSRTVYHYDNLQEHTRPTRIVSYDSQGDSTVVHQVYAGDMAATASEAIAAMQEANILAPVIKRATMKDGALVEEEVTVYGTSAKEDGCFYAPVKVVVRNGSNGSYTPDTLSLYTGGIADYQERREMMSAVIGGDSYLPVGMTEQGMHTALLHDPNSKWCVLQATDVSADKVVAVDCRHYRLNALMDNTDTMGRILYLAEKLQEGIEGYNPESIELDNYQTFRETPFYERGKRMLELLAKESDSTEVSALLDSCAVDGYIGIGDYIAWQIELAYSYFPAEGIVSPWNMPVEEMQELLDLLMEELYTHNGTVLLDYLRTSGGSFWNGFEYVPQTLAALSGQQGYKLYLVPMKEQALVTYTVTHNGGTEERVLELSGLTPGILKEVSVDLSGYTHVSGITVTGFGAVQHLTLVPEGTEFEATSYNADGTVSVKYNQDGQMQYHEYDNAGRLIRVRDENGKILETSDYHVKNTTF